MVDWKAKKDGSGLVGRVQLNRAENGSFGVKVVGGRPTPDGRLSAFVTRVLPGSPADTMGHLLAGHWAYYSCRL